jgi:hypothetical protein
MTFQYQGKSYTTQKSYRHAVRQDIRRQLAEAETVQEYIRALQVLTGVQL